MAGKLNYMENDAELDGQWSNLMDKDGFQRQQMDFRNNGMKWCFNEDIKTYFPPILIEDIEPDDVSLKP